jgi:hypothetical protein
MKLGNPDKILKRTKQGLVKEMSTNCIKCWKIIKIKFTPPVKTANVIEVECCKYKRRNGNKK